MSGGSNNRVLVSASSSGWILESSGSSGSGVSPVGVFVTGGPVGVFASGGPVGVFVSGGSVGVFGGVSESRTWVVLSNDSSLGFWESCVPFGGTIELCSWCRLFFKSD